MRIEASAFLCLRFRPHQQASCKILLFLFEFVTEPHDLLVNKLEDNVQLSINFFGVASVAAAWALHTAAEGTGV